jgi:hypothetical protein
LVRAVDDDVSSSPAVLDVMRKMRLGVARDDGRAGADGRRRGRGTRAGKAVNYSNNNFDSLKFAK